MMKNKIAAVLLLVYCVGLFSSVGFGAEEKADEEPNKVMARKAELDTSDLLRLLRMRAVKYDVEVSEKKAVAFRYWVEEYSNKFDAPKVRDLNWVCMPVRADNKGCSDILSKAPSREDPRFCCHIFGHSQSSKIDFMELNENKNNRFRVSFPDELDFSFDGEIILAVMMHCADGPDPKRTPCEKGEDPLGHRFREDLNAAKESGKDYHFAVVKVALKFCDSVTEASQTINELLNQDIVREDSKFEKVSFDEFFPEQE